MKTDRYDLPLTTGSDRAAAFYRDGVDRILSAWYGADDAFDKAIARRPRLRARLHRAGAHPPAQHGDRRGARQGSARARVGRNHNPSRTPARRDSGRRHRGSTEIGFDRRRAASRRVSSRCAGISLLLGAFGLYAFSGRADHDAARLAICERHARHYGEDWWFLTYLGWSHTEAGNVGIGRTTTERAIALRPENANAAHALSHALFEQGDMAAGRTFLSAWLPAHEHASFLHCHLSWHVALTALEAGDLDGALGIYQQHIRPSGRPVSTTERFYGLRVAAVAAFTRRQDRS